MYNYTIYFFHQIIWRKKNIIYIYIFIQHPWRRTQNYGESMMHGPFDLASKPTWLWSLQLSTWARVWRNAPELDYRIPSIFLPLSMGRILQTVELRPPQSQPRTFAFVGLPKVLNEKKGSFQCWRQTKISERGLKIHSSLFIVRFKRFYVYIPDVEALCIHPQWSKQKIYEDPFLGDLIIYIYTSTYIVLDVFHSAILLRIWHAANGTATLRTCYGPRP